MTADTDTPSHQSARAIRDAEAVDDADQRVSESAEQIARPHDSIESTDSDSDEVRPAVDSGVDVKEGEQKPVPKARTRRRIGDFRWALIVGLATVLATGGLTGWLVYQTDQSHQTLERRELFLHVGRQAAVNLTTLDYATVDADVQRILDSATGQFYDDFQRRSPTFIQLLRQAQSKSEGTIAEAGLESASDTQAQVLVAVRVTTSNAGAPDQRPRGWRMRISVQMVGANPKVSNVDFVP
jgi:Mce-associated membrane protein